MAEQPDEKTIALPAPVKFAEVEYTELKLRAPTAAEWSKADKIGGVDGDILLTSLVAGVPKSAVEMMPAHLVNRAARYMTGFFDQPEPMAAAS